jgi:hypothetical protein
VAALTQGIIAPAVLDSDNAQSDVVLVGGRDVAGAPLTRTVWLTRVGGAVDVCASDDGACFGDVQPLTCARAGAAAVVLADGSDLAQSLVVGGELDDACGATTSVERVRLAFEPAYVRAFAAATSPVAWGAGVTATALPGGRALVVGGLDAAGAPRGDSALFALAPGGEPDGGGGFVAAGSLTTPTAFHAAAFVGGAVVVAGGLAADGASARVEIFLPGAP